MLWLPDVTQMSGPGSGTTPVLSKYLTQELTAGLDVTSVLSLCLPLVSRHLVYDVLVQT